MQSDEISNLHEQRHFITVDIIKKNSKSVYYNKNTNTARDTVNLETIEIKILKINRKFTMKRNLNLRLNEIKLQKGAKY